MFLPISSFETIHNSMFSKEKVTALNVCALLCNEKLHILQYFQNDATFYLFAKFRKSKENELTIDVKSGSLLQDKYK